MTKHLLARIYVFIFRLRNKIFRGFMRLFKLRPSSYPYITGDGFRKIADHVYDETGKCLAQDVKEGQIVFVKSNLIKDWFEDMHPHVENKYKLITHNSDYNIRESDLKHIDDKIIAWFAQNDLASHPRIIPIPFGLDNFYYYTNGIISLFDKYSKKILDRKNRIIFGFTIGTNPGERQPAYDFLIDSEVADKLPWIDNAKIYLDEIIKYKFIAAPDGNGHDDPRRWQAMYINMVPILRRSPAMDYFKSLGLPMFVIDNWNELKGKSEDDLASLYEDILSHSSREALYFDYWEKVIKNTGK